MGTVGVGLAIMTVLERGGMLRVARIEGFSPTLAVVGKQPTISTVKASIQLNVRDIVTNTQTALGHTSLCA